MATAELSLPSAPPAKTTLYYGWIIVGICTATVFVVTGTKGTIGALFKDMQRDLGWGRGTTAGSSAISTLAWALTLPLVGPLVDRYGAKRVMVASILLMIVVVIPIFWVKSLWALYLFFGILPGAAIAGSTIVPAASLMGRWFHRRAGVRHRYYIISVTPRLGDLYTRYSGPGFPTRMANLLHFY